MNDDQLLLASAYLDDDVDDAARARAEGDPDVLAEAARLRALRTALRDVEVPDPDRRERALAAALAAFADEPVARTGAPPAPVPLPRRNRRWGGVLAAAAAALLVVVAGAVVVRTGGSSDGDDTSSEDVALEAPAATESDGGDDRSAAAPQVAQDEDAGASAATSAAAEATTATGSVAATELAGLDPTLTDTEDLAEYARRASTAADAVPGAPSCATAGTFLGLATYAGTPVEVVDDEGLVSAVDVATCAVVAQVRL
jgi:hypothetical protein